MAGHVDIALLHVDEGKYTVRMGDDGCVQNIHSVDVKMWQRSHAGLRTKNK